MNRWTWHHHANYQLHIIMQSATLPYKKVQNKHGKQLNFLYHFVLEHTRGLVRPASLSFARTRLNFRYQSKFRMTVTTSKLGLILVLYWIFLLILTLSFSGLKVPRTEKHVVLTLTLNSTSTFLGSPGIYRSMDWLDYQYWFSLIKLYINRCYLGSGPTKSNARRGYW